MRIYKVRMDSVSSGRYEYESIKYPSPDMYLTNHYNCLLKEGYVYGIERDQDLGNKYFYIDIDFNINRSLIFQHKKVKKETKIGDVSDYIKWNIRDEKLNILL